MENQQPPEPKQMEILPTDFALIMDGLKLMQTEMDTALGSGAPFNSEAIRHIRDIKHWIGKTVDKITTGHHEFILPEINVIQMGLQLLIEQSADMLTDKRFKNLAADKVVMFKSFHDRSVELQALFDQTRGETFKMDVPDDTDMAEFLTNYDPNNPPS